LSKIIQENNYSYLSTGTPTYWPTDGNKIPDPLDFFVTNGIYSSHADIQPSHDLTSDHSPIIATISTAVVIRKPTTRLHNAKTNWETYRQIIREKAKLSIKLKDYKHIELETNNLIKVLQNAAKEATPNNDPQNTTNNIPYEIKKLIAEKRKARSTWQRTHTPDSRKRYNQTNNKLKSKLQEMRNESFKAYVSSLKRDDNTIWKPIKHKKKPKVSQTPIRKNSTPPGPWAKSDKEKLTYLWNISQKYSLHTTTAPIRKWNKT